MIWELIIAGMLIIEIIVCCLLIITVLYGVFGLSWYFINGFIGLFKKKR